MLLIVGALCVGGVFGGGIGGAVGLATTEPNGPSAPPSMAAQFPNTAHHYLPGVKASDITDKWLKEANKWTCAPSDFPLKRTKEQVDCEPTDSLKNYVYVTVDFDDDDHVTSVRAKCRLKPGANACQSLFGTMADALFLNQPDFRQEAHDWARENADTDNAKAFGGILLQVSLEPHEMIATPQP